VGRRDQSDEEAGGVLSREEYLAAWSRWHGGTGTESGLVRGWLSLAYGLARPLAGLPPVVATALGLVVAGAAIVPAAAGGGWLIAAGLLVGLSGLVDSLDGALAIGTGRASQRGFVLDSVVDRLTEAAYAAAFWVAGAPGWLAVAFGALCWLPDYLRARAGQAGVDRTGPISVWERPARVAMAGMTLVGAGVVSGLGWAGVVMTTGAGVGAVLGLVATVQLGLWLRGVLEGPEASGGAGRTGGS
jgi:CDP-diacylglycerol--glycerol-3-phosphate 3-phosphatidyltransferase